MSRNVPNVNASLIREVRMIAQQFFRSKSDASFWNSYSKVNSPKEKTHIISLTCAPCIRTGRGTPEPAITVTKGEAVCHIHMVS